MSSVAMQDLLSAGMHFGHLTRRWNPKMKPYIYGVRNGVHIIDLSKTAKKLSEALNFIVEAVGEGRNVLFVGTKRQAQDIIEEQAKRCEMYYVNRRWLGGMITNWKTIKASINRLNDLQKKKNDGTFDSLNKKELLMIDREIEKLLHSLGGIQQLSKPPGLMIIVDPKVEHIALHEAKLLGIPVVALADTNCDPDQIDFLVPGNDDALRSIEVFLQMVSDKVLEGLKLRESKARQESQAKREKAKDKPAVREVEVGGAASGTYVGDRKAASDENEAAAGQYSAKVTAEVTTEADVEANAEVGESPAESTEAASSQEVSAQEETSQSSEAPQTASEENSEEAVEEENDKSSEETSEEASEQNKE